MTTIFFHFRASEIIFSVANAKMLEKSTSSQFPKDNLYKKLVQARRNLGIFQHHDGVTGTAKDHVVNDYGLKYLKKISLFKILYFSTDFKQP
jgi:alpha-mannosidase II